MSFKPGKGLQVYKDSFWASEADDEILQANETARRAAQRAGTHWSGLTLHRTIEINQGWPGMIIVRWELR